MVGKSTDLPTTIIMGSIRLHIIGTPIHRMVGVVVEEGIHTNNKLSNTIHRCHLKRSLSHLR